jgi:hypothetical protein
MESGFNEEDVKFPTDESSTPLQLHAHEKPTQLNLPMRSCHLCD